jgi:hypothetical protein
MESFLVRVWRPEPRERLESRLRGVVRRVATGEERVFASEAELLAFLRAEAHDLEGAAGTPSAP